MDRIIDNKKFYLAIDIGASSGRHILGYIDNGKLKIEEIYRFTNQIVNQDDSMCWDLDYLFTEILHGLSVCKQLGKIPVSIGIDTWGVDYVLLDSSNKIIGKTYAYRDHRTDNTDKIVEKVISAQELYSRTGIQKQNFNTIYQLVAFKTTESEKFAKAEKLLMIPDYFAFLLTGFMGSEYTNATTTQLVNVKTKNWDYELLDKLQIKQSLFCPISQSGTNLGGLKREIVDQIGFDTHFIQVATHDTGSAVAAVPIKNRIFKTSLKDFIYISSGTWSLMGVERLTADCSEKSRLANFTNEGGCNGRYRFLKNIMGLWMIQSVRHELGDKYSFTELCNLAEEVDSRKASTSTEKLIIDVNDPRFLSPVSMIKAVQEVCIEKGFKKPETPGEIASVIYNSLAVSYAETIKEIESITGKHYRSINIVGGGSNADLLNRLTAKETGCSVYSGPAEATAIGNLIIQMITENVFRNLDEARNVVFNSFKIEKAGTK